MDRTSSCGRRAARGAAAAGLAALLVLTAGGCGAAEMPHHRVSRDPLLNELAHLHDTPATRAGVAYGDLAQQRAAHITGLGGYGTLDAPPGTGFGFDPHRADQAATTGRPPHRAGRFDGPALREDSLTAALRRLGGRRLADGGIGAAPVWRLNTEGAPPTGALSAAAGGSAGYDVVHAARGVFAHGPDSAAAVTVDAGNNRPSLAENPAFREAAACLGRPLAAELTDGGSSRQHRTGGYALAAGVVRGPGRGVTVVACRTLRKGEDAGIVAAALVRRLGGHGGRWAGQLTGVRSTVRRGDESEAVRVTARPARGAPPDALLRAVRDGTV